MEKADLVIVGAEGVVESGGIINKVSLTCIWTNTSFISNITDILISFLLSIKSVFELCNCLIRQIGTYQMAVCAKAHNKPFYVVAESFKFVRLYPLNQQDVPDRFKVSSLQFRWSDLD